MNRAAVRGWAVLTLAWLWFCWPLLTGQAVGFRDAVDLYGPLFDYLDRCQEMGLSPFWNPYCNFGEPLAATGAAALFYPGRWIIQALPISGIDQLSWYTAVHLYLAMWFAYRLALGWGCNVWGALIAGLSYGLGGSVLFQVTNVIYLVGAAWLPLAILSGSRALGSANWRAGGSQMAIAALAIAMMILGGDPQMAYHCWLIIALMALILPDNHPLERSDLQNYNWNKRLAIVATIVGLSLSLAAVQILLSREWLPWTERAAFTQPRSIFEMFDQSHTHYAQPIGDSTRSAIWGEPLHHTHHDDLYQFSQPPRTLMEWVWPNISGHTYPHHTRWVEGLPDSERMWTPSLYCGGLVLLLALRRLRLSGSDRHAVLCTWLAMAFTVGSFGWFGGGWLLHELGLAREIGSPVGGFYWMLVTVLPDYVMFRYPAKLLVIAQLGMAILAGLELSHLRNSITSRWALVLPAALLALSLAGLIGSPWIFASIARLNIVDNSFNGSFDPTRASWEILFSLGHGAGLYLLSLIWLANRTRSAAAPRWWLAAGVIAVGLDLVIANRQLIPTVPRNDLYLAQTYYSPGLLNAAALEDDMQMDLLYQATALAEAHRRTEWGEESDPLRRWVQSQQMLLAAKHHLPLALEANLRELDRPPRLSDSFSSVESWHRAWWLEHSREWPPHRINFVVDPPVISRLPDSYRVPPQFLNGSARASLRNAFQNCAVEGFPGDDLDSDTTRRAARFFPERVTCIAMTPGMVQLESESDEPGWVLLCDLFAPGWQAQVINLETGQKEEVTVHRMQAMFRGVPVPAGRYQILFSYQPASLGLARWIAMGGYVFCILLIVASNNASQIRVE